MSSTIAITGLRSTTLEHEEAASIATEHNRVFDYPSDEVYDFLANEELDETELPLSSYHEYSCGRNVIEVDLSKLPKDIKKLRFTHDY